MVGFVAKARPDDAKANSMTNEISLRYMENRRYGFHHISGDFPRSAAGRSFLLAASILPDAPDLIDATRIPRASNPARLNEDHVSGGRFYHTYRPVGNIHRCKKFARMRFFRGRFQEGTETGRGLRLICAHPLLSVRSESCFHKLY